MVVNPMAHFVEFSNFEYRISLARSKYYPKGNGNGVVHSGRG